LDHLIIVDERHLRKLLRDYAAYYNRLRTHLSLNKDTPFGRAVQSHGALCRLPHFGGLHRADVVIGRDNFFGYQVKRRPAMMPWDVSSPANEPVTKRSIAPHVVAPLLPTIYQMPVCDEPTVFGETLGECFVMMLVTRRTNAVV
jgi:hypothetical protein